MDMTLEVIPLPVSDIDRARDFYRDQVGHRPADPPGSGCSIALGDTLWETTPGPTRPPAPIRAADIEKAHAEFAACGLEISEPVRYADAATFMLSRERSRSPSRRERHRSPRRRAPAHGRLTERTQ